MLLSCLASASRADEPEAVPIEQGARAPFAGILLPPGRAAKLGVNLELCETKLKLNEQLFGDTLQIRADAAKAVLDIERLAGEEKQKLLLKQLEDAREQAKRDWWDNPEMLVAIGVVGGVALTVGAVYLVGALRPTIPAG